MKTQLKKDEKVILITKPHWLTLGGSFLIMLAGFVIGILIGSYGLIVTLISIGYFIYEIIKRNNNIWVVTSLRVIDEYGVFSNNAKESPRLKNKINRINALIQFTLCSTQTSSSAVM